MFTDAVYQMMLDNDEMWVTYKPGAAILILDLPLMDA